MIKAKKILTALTAACSMVGFTAEAAEGNIIRHPVSNANVPVSAAVETPANTSLVYLSGKLPPLQDSSHPSDSPLAYGGDTEGQTVAVLAAIKNTLDDLGLSLSDIIKVQVFLVGDPALGNKMDLPGFTKGYAKFFGTNAQTNLPARTLIQVSGLANRAFLVEIDVIAARHN